jgi:hypothetical protein
LDSGQRPLDELLLGLWARPKLGQGLEVVVVVVVVEEEEEEEGEAEVVVELPVEEILRLLLMVNIYYFDLWLAFGWPDFEGSGCF